MKQYPGDVEDTIEIRNEKQKSPKPFWHTICWRIQEHHCHCHKIHQHQGLNDIDVPLLVWFDQQVNEENRNGAQRHQKLQKKIARLRSSIVLGNG